LRDKIRRSVQQTFSDHLSANEYASFCTEFNRKGHRLSTQITEDHTPFSRDAPRHIWSISRDPDGPSAASIPAPSIATLQPTGSGPAYGSSGRIANALLPDRPAAASIPAPGGATQLPCASVPGSASTAALLPAGSGPADGSGDRVAPPALPPLTGLRQPRAAASPPAPDKPGPPGSANRTAPKTPRTSETTCAANRGLKFGAGPGGPAGRETAATGGPEPYQSHINSLADCLLHWQFWTNSINLRAASEHPLHEKPLHEKPRTSRESRHPCPEGIFPLPPSVFSAFFNQRMIALMRITTELMPYGMDSLLWMGMSALL
jgi:hypothetical protein